MTKKKSVLKLSSTGTTFKYLGLTFVIYFIDSIVFLRRIVETTRKPLIRIGKNIIKNFFLNMILSSYFLILKFRKRIKIALNSGRHRLWSLFNMYVYRFTLVVLIIITVSVNLSSRNTSAEELHSNILLSSVVNTLDNPPLALYEEGPIDAQTQGGVSNYVGEDTVSTNGFTDLYGIDFDDEDLFATTEGESAIIAPIILDPDGLQPSGRSSIESYVVESGDTISSIAQKFGINTNTILWENNLGFNATIRPGQKLQILPTNGVSHKVASGETVSQIAKKYQANSDDIVSVNKLADAGDIYIGEVLIVPGGVKPSTVSRISQPRSLPSAIKDIFVPAEAVDAGGQLLWPIGSHRITQYYHYGHSGIDVGDSRGNPIYAAESGKVERSGWNSSGYGYNIIINHGNGLKTLYAHASELLVNVGDTVARGDVIARVGSTGRSTGNHLHFEVIVSGRKLNPLNYTR